MNFDYYLLILPLVASLIGYSTNWLAIRMLFRPLEEKRIFGYRIPFTPGLIPKRRNEIAENIGQAVGEHLLTPEALEERLKSPAVREQLEGGLENWLIDFLERERGSLMDGLPEESRSDVIAGLDVLAGKVERWLGRVATGEDMESFLQGLVKNGVDLLSRKQLGELVDQWSYEELAITLEEISAEVTGREEVRTNIEEFWLGKLREFREKGGSLEDYLGEELEALLIRQVEANVPFLLGKGAELLDRPELRSRLKEVTVNLLDERINGEFDEDSVWDQVKRGFLETLVMPRSRMEKEVSKMIDEGIPELIELMEQEEFRGAAAESGVNTLKKFLRKDVSELLPSGEGIERVAGVLTDFSVATIRSEKVRSFVFQGLVEVLKNSEEKRLDELVELEQSEEREALVNAVSGYLLETLESEEVQDELRRLIADKLKDLRKKKIGKLSRWIEPELITPFTGPLVDELIGIVSREGSELVGAIDVEEVVRQEVRGFSMVRVEQLVLDVTGDQFNAITWFGALIGLIVGLLQVLIIVVGG
ncbi:DUF445 family protein [Candidatus Bipolaricaulota bacterium]|nr:DUF445 family protein [Candidatus Bipolaricaulota bacterium]